MKSASTFAKFYFADVNGDSCADKIYWNRFVSAGSTRVFMSNCNGAFPGNVVIDTGSGSSTSATTQFSSLT